MNYIGSKQKLSPWIKDVVEKTYNGNLKNAVFADLFAGTGQVGRYFKSSVKQVISNDLEKYAFILNSHYVGNTQNNLETKLVEKIIGCNKKQGIIFNEFSPGGNQGRMYFTEENAIKIDSYRAEIEQLLVSGVISRNDWFALMTALLEASDKVANTASVYGAFLKKFKKTALRDIEFKILSTEETQQENLVFNEDANELIKKIKGDILYLDPPYNQRQYGSNYHVLNRIVENSPFISKNKTGIGDYNRSDYCRKEKVLNVFEDLLKNSDFPFVYVSYNNEGLIKEKDFVNVMKKFGKYSCFKKEYQRFKADNNRKNVSDKTDEFLHVLIRK